MVTPKAFYPQEKKRLIDLPRSVIPACDVSSLEELERIVKETAEVPGIGGYKVGLELVIRFGLPEVVRVVRFYTQRPVIYDHQKGGTDIPELGVKFAQAVCKSSADAVILFPFGGAATEREWIKACQAEGLTVLVGGHMTRREFLVSEGGFINGTGPEQIYTIAAETGVRDFVVPGNKVEFVERYKRLLDEILGEGEYTLYAPGFIAQGGDITETGEAAGDNWHAIVGRAIYGAENIKEAARQVTSKII